MTHGRKGAVLQLGAHDARFSLESEYAEGYDELDYKYGISLEVPLHAELSLQLELLGDTWVDAKIENALWDAAYTMWAGSMATAADREWHERGCDAVMALDANEKAARRTKDCGTIDTAACEPL